MPCAILSCRYLVYLVCLGNKRNYFNFIMEALYTYVRSFVEAIHEKNKRRKSFVKGICGRKQVKGFLTIINAMGLLY